jgi:hypothetical protein
MIYCPQTNIGKAPGWSRKGIGTLRNASFAMLFASFVCAGMAQTPNVSGNWQITARSSIYKIQTSSAGQITQTGTSVYAQFNITGSPCSSFGAGNGTITGLQFNLTLNEAYQLVQFSGVTSSDGSSASGTYSAPLTGCTNGDRGTWSGTRISGAITAITNAASGSTTDIAIGSIISLYGTGLCVSTGQAVSIPLPQECGNNAFAVYDGKGQTTALSLFYGSPTQVNAQIPQNVSPGLVLLGELSCPSGPTCSGSLTQNFNTRTQAAGIYFSNQRLTVWQTRYRMIQRRV